MKYLEHFIFVNSDNNFSKVKYQEATVGVLLESKSMMSGEAREGAG